MFGKQNTQNTNTISFSNNDASWGTENIVQMGLTCASMREERKSVSEAVKVLQKEGIADKHMSAITTAICFGNRLKHRMHSSRGRTRKPILQRRNTLNVPEADSNGKNLRFSLTEDNGITKYLDQDLMFSQSSSCDSTSASDYSDQELDMLVQKSESMRENDQVRRAAMVLKRAQSVRSSSPSKKKRFSRSPSDLRNGYRISSTGRKKSNGIFGKNVRKIVGKSRLQMPSKNSQSAWMSAGEEIAQVSKRASQKSAGKRKSRKSKKRSSKVMMQVIFPDFSTNVTMTPNTKVSEALRRLRNKFRSCRMVFRACGVEIEDKSWTLGVLNQPIHIIGRYNSSDEIVFSDTEDCSSDDETEFSISVGPSFPHGAISSPSTTPYMSEAMSSDSEAIPATPVTPSVQSAPESSPPREVKAVPIRIQRFMQVPRLARAKTSSPAKRRSKSATPAKLSLVREKSAPVEPLQLEPEAQIHPKLLKKSGKESVKREVHLGNAGLKKGWYRVVGKLGCVVRAGSHLKSQKVLKLQKGSRVNVLAIEGNRMRISLPQKGWVSFQARNGAKILKFEAKSLLETEKKAPKQTEGKREKNDILNFILDASQEMLQSCMTKLYKERPSLLEKIVGQVYLANRI